MEKVIDLFKAFRSKEIEYDELFGALTKMLSEDPHFSAQAIQSLDSAQQLTPIPVTDFIQLRAQLETTAETFRQQETTDGPAEAEATIIFSGDDQTLQPESQGIGASDPTLINPPVDASSPAPAAQQPVANSDYADEATVIMPMPPRTTAENSPAQAPAMPEADEHASLIATPPPEPLIEAQATPVPAAEPAPQAPATPKAPQKPTKPGIPPVALVGGGITALALVVLIAIFWPSSSENTEAPTQAEKPSEETSPWNPAPEPVIKPEPSTATIAETEEPATQADPNGEFANTAEPVDTLAVETIEIEQSKPTNNESEVIEEPAVKDKAYFLAKIKDAVNNDNLGPADQPNTATYYLVELIKLDQYSDEVSDARALIAKKHLELAKKARQQSRWDDAQQHLDDAFKVRLPDSYLP